jgi:hypothetical protein
MAQRGTLSPTIMPDRAPIAGARTVWRDGVMIASFSACRSRSGTVRTPILKVRLFGLANAEGNHGEDVKEVYHYLDATQTHSYLRSSTAIRSGLPLL